MKVIIAGSRGIDGDDAISIISNACEESGFDATVIIHGCAAGVDTAAHAWARDNDLDVCRIPAEWDRYGKRAGPMRNLSMALVADALIAIWDGESRGTANMIATAERLGLKVHVHNLKETR